MRVWLYYRLSRDEDEDMNSLQNQRQILVDYSEQNGYEIVGESFDDNVSGMTFDRKGLNEMEDAVCEGKIDMVLVKDLSRLGRHRTQTALFIDHLRENNVKVYSVTEGIDTANENDDLLIGFKQIFNDFYAKDISKKIRTGLRQKQKNTGIVLTLPLGYYLDRNTGTVNIDDECADIVREVFRLYVSGYGLTTIARLMNERGIKSPEYYQNRRLADWKPKISKKYLWVQTSVKRILTNELYIGTMVNHKTVTSRIYKTKNFVPEEEQYRHENFCEPIIEKTLWDQAQSVLESRSKSKPRAKDGRKIHRYSGLIKCADCGSCFVAKERKSPNGTYIEYTCNSHHRYGKQYCTPHRIHESQLDEIIYSELERKLDEILAEGEKYEKIIKEWQRKKPSFEHHIEKSNDRIIALKLEIENLIMERINDREHIDVFNGMIAKREEEIAQLQRSIEEYRDYDKVCKQRKNELRDSALVLETIIREGFISYAALRMLVSCIRIHQREDKQLDVNLELNGKFSAGTCYFIEPEFYPEDYLDDQSRGA